MYLQYVLQLFSNFEHKKTISFRDRNALKIATNVIFFINKIVFQTIRK